MKLDHCFLGDCIEIMRGMADNSVDSIVTDPPYHLTTNKKGGTGPASVNLESPYGRSRVTTGFMGMTWDGGDIAFCVELWSEALRVLKPGGHLLAFSGSRTYHRMTCAIEDAGFEIRDQIMWVYGSGFPKSMDVSKAIDKSAGAERVEISTGKAVKRMIPGADQNNTGSWIKDNGREYVPTVTEPATDSARQWQGFGTALKPAHEPICLARKPLSGTVVANVLQHGTGAINIDGCRVASGQDHADKCASVVGLSSARTDVVFSVGDGRPREDSFSPLGRWPANLIHDGSAEVVALFPSSAGAGGSVPNVKITGYGDGIGTGKSEYFGGDRKAFDSGSGSAARFFYCAKASRHDRNEGMEDPGPQFAHGNTLRKVENAQTSGNNHPTVKPTDLMRYLCRLVTPPGGTVLDPFMGSGSTGKAAVLEGFQFIGIEKDAGYAEIAEARIAHARAVADEDTAQMGLFA